MLKKIMVSAGAAAIVAAATVMPAGAQETTFLSDNPIPMPAINAADGYTWKNDGVVVNYRNMKPNTMMFVTICRRDQNDPKFGTWSSSCSNLSEIVVNPSSVGDGNGSMTFPIFRGDNPDGDATWGCYAEGDTAPAGVEKITTCYVRLASGTQSDKSYSHTIPFTITDDGNVETTTTTTPGGVDPGDPDPVIPEAGTVIALPIIAGGIAAVALGAQRRRRALNG